MGKRIEEEKYYRLGEERELEYLGGYIGHTHHKVTWRCKKGHLFLANYHNIQSGQGCRACSDNRKRIPKGRYHQCAKEKGVVFLGGYTGNSHDNVSWECAACGYEWASSYNNISQGYGCARCAGNLRLTEEDYNSLDSRNIKWVGTELPNNNRAKTPWRCLVCGYEWLSIYNSISQGSGCPKCVGKARITEEDYNSFVSRNVKWIGEELPRTIKIKTSWLCLKCGNRWRTTYDCVKGRGSGCPRCANMVNGTQASTQQAEIAEMLGAEVNHQFDDSRRRIDCAIPERMIAVEYDGWYYHGCSAQEDYNRAMEVVEQGWRVLSIKSNSALPSREQLDESIAQLDAHPYIELILDDWGKGSVRGK